MGNPAGERGERMKAAVCDVFGKPLTIREVPTPSPGPGEGVGTSLIVSGFPKTSHTAAFIRSPLSPAGFPISIPYLVIIVEHPVLGTLNVVVLIALHRPQEEQPGGKS